MTGQSDSRNALVGLVDEVARLNGRLKSIFADARRAVDLGESEMTVLNAVVEAERAPTASQIARSLGVPRQQVQRAVHSLESAGLLAPAPNPDHKRAALLVATAEGTATKRRADARADAIAAQFTAGMDMDAAREAARALRAVRRELEARLRAGGE